MIWATYQTLIHVFAIIGVLCVGFAAWDFRTDLKRRKRNSRI